MKCGLIGEGFVGSALRKSMELKGVEVFSYDKYKKIGSFELALNNGVIFMCLPTPFIVETGYDLSPIEENLSKLSKANYEGVVVIKSTTNIGTCKTLSEKYNLKICHNPEFLTERTAFEDFHNQKHIVIGYDKSKKDLSELYSMYSDNYNAKINTCSTMESESMKLFCNNFYAQKIMIFNEYYSLCKKLNIDYNNVKSLMLENNWINEMHTVVPGPDGKMAYGGNCFPKDTMALLKQMIDEGSIHMMLKSCVEERDSIRNDKPNVI